MKLFPLVWSNLKRNKVRTTFTVLSVFVSFLLFGFLVAVDNAFTSVVFTTVNCGLSNWLVFSAGSTCVSYSSLGPPSRETSL